MTRKTLMLLAAALIVGCTTPEKKPDYTRPLDPGASALQKTTDWPDLKAAFNHKDQSLLDALDRSIAWFLKPSTDAWFPIEGITHQQAWDSVKVAKKLLTESPDAETFEREFKKLFDAYESVGWDGRGTVFFTGYYSPVFQARTARDSRFRYPIYRRPKDLLTDPETGKPLGRKMPDGTTAPYPTRAEIESTRMLAGQELAWLRDSLSAYLIHVNGSAKLELTDGSTMFVGYAGKTDRAYSSLGKALVDEGVLTADEVNLAAIRRVYARDPETVERLMRRNDSYVFFRKADGKSWPAGSLGFRVAAERTIATDKSIFPRGGLVFVDTASVARGMAHRMFRGFMLDQDTGGAIRAPGRADVFMGTGAGAESLAGAQKSEGRLVYFFLR